MQYWGGGSYFSPCLRKYVLDHNFVFFCSADATWHWQQKVATATRSTAHYYADIVLISHYQVMQVHMQRVHNHIIAIVHETLEGK